MENKIFYCSICFSPYQKSYYYKTFDEDIGVGDLVVVPVGNYDYEAKGIVKKVESFMFHEVPYPLPKTKTILRKESYENYPDFLIIREAIINDSEDYEEVLVKSKTKEHDFLSSQYLLLCDVDRNEIHLKIWAELNNGCLQVFGQDIGSLVSDVWGKSEYEYFYKLDFENTEQLFHVLTTLYGDVTKGIMVEFSGEDACIKLRKFCEEYLIHYSFYNYA
jgi:hypothetical protein